MNTTEQIGELLLRWEELREQGQDLSAEELCRDCPELTEAVRRRILALRKVYEVPNAADSGTLLDRRGPGPGPLPMIPGYDLLVPLGQGGMGMVYQARDRKLNRTVALKMILSGAHAGPEQLQRFRAEAEAAARLQHPNIVQIFEIGEKDGAPYLALEYVDGGNLAQKLNGTPLPPRQAAELVQTLALAIQHAHERGIIHRDLKPANILLVSGGVVSSESLQPTDHSPLIAYQPKISDFGLAKRLDVKMGQTQTGAILGTPSYMAPEQAEGKTRDIGPATDVYALGVILYELLTGRPPFQGTTVLETLEQVRAQAPVPLRFLQPNLPRDLDSICLKCLAKQPTRRYVGAGELANDLGRFLSSEPIRARSYNLFARLSHTLERSEKDFEFRAAANILLLFAPIIFLANLGVFLLAPLGGSPLWLVLPTLAIFCLFMGVLFWHPWWRRLLPASPATRRFGSIILANILSTLLVPLLCGLLAGPEQPLSGLAQYPFWALLIGVMFFSLGSDYWGRLYLIGLAFFAVSILMTLNLDWAPLEFGLLTGLTTLVLGLRLRRLGNAMMRGDP